MTYKPLGQVATLTKPNGVVITYSYEDRELLSQRVYTQGMVVLGTDTFTYYPNHLLKTAHGGLYGTDIDRSTLATDYDGANRLDPRAGEHRRGAQIAQLPVHARFARQPIDLSGRDGRRPDL